MSKCTDCGKPMQYCECKFTMEKLVSLPTPLDHYFSGVDWSDVKITARVYNLHANIAPMTECEYFQQIGDE